MTKRNKNKGRSFGVIVLGLSLLSLIVAFLLRGKDVVLLNPKGFIAREQYDLLLVSTVIMVAFAVPVLFFLYYFAWRYRESNNKVEYRPHKENNKFSAFAIWAMPTAIAIVLAAIMIPATHRLEPQDRIKAANDSLTIQVVALRWKWLFIYPEQNIATINFVQLPVDTPVEFQLTADETPMSSFWIPHLGGMLYAMPEHVNRLNLMPDTTGDFEGSAAEINGHGFAAMRFDTRVSTSSEFESWVDNIKASAGSLTSEDYQALLQPSEDNEVTFYSDPVPDLFATILGKYAGSHGGEHGSYTEHGAH